MAKAFCRKSVVPTTYALSTDGINNRVDFTSDDGFRFTDTQKISIIVETCPGDVSAALAAILANRGSFTSSNNFFFGHNNDGKIYFAYYGLTATHEWTSTNIVLANGVWANIEFHYNFGTPDSLTLTINGSPVLGSWTGGTGDQINSAVFTKPNIAAAHDGGLSVNYKGLYRNRLILRKSNVALADWNMGFGAGSVLPDDSGNNRNGTIVGATWVEV